MNHLIFVSAFKLYLHVLVVFCSVVCFLVFSCNFAAFVKSQYMYVCVHNVARIVPSYCQYLSGDGATPRPFPKSSSASDTVTNIRTYCQMLRLIGTVQCDSGIADILQ